MKKNRISGIPLYWKFFGLTFLLTWACWIPAGILPAGKYGVLIKGLHYAGGMMPALVTLVLLYLCFSRQQRREYWLRLMGLKRIHKAWYFVILLIVPALTAVGIISDLLLGGAGAEPEAAANLILNPFSLIPFAIFTLLFGPLPEEMAWRGCALDSLQIKWNALTASLILGTLWTLWHLPLFFIENTYQYGLGVGTPQFWLYMLDKIPQSVLMTWIYNNNQRSTASAVLFHFMVNFVGELFDLTLRAETIYISAWWIAVLIVIVIWNPQKLVRMKSLSSGR